MEELIAKYLPEELTERRKIYEEEIACGEITGLRMRKAVVDVVNLMDLPIFCHTLKTS